MGRSISSSETGLLFPVAKILLPDQIAGWSLSNWVPRYWCCCLLHWYGQCPRQPPGGFSKAREHSGVLVLVGVQCCNRTGHLSTCPLRNPRALKALNPLQCVVVCSDSKRSSIQVMAEVSDCVNHSKHLFLGSAVLALTTVQPTTCIWDHSLTPVLLLGNDCSEAIVTRITVHDELYITSGERPVQELLPISSSAYGRPCHTLQTTGIFEWILLSGDARRVQSLQSP